MRPPPRWRAGWPERPRVIGQVLPRGSSVRGLLYYLFTEGQAGNKGLESAHTDPRVIASWDGAPWQLQPPVCGGKRDFAGLTSRLNEPLLALEMTAAERKKAKPVFHLAVAAAKDPHTGELVDRYLSDEQWADIAGEYMHRLGLARRSDEQAVRWVAIRHADDHVHIVATLARQDGRRAHPSNERYRSREASRFLEDKYGLRATSAAGGAGRAPTSRAEARKHAETTARQRAAGRPVPVAPDRQVLRRQVRVAAAGAASLPEFLARLRDDGLLVRERFSTVNAGEVTGYAVALPDKYDSAGEPIFFGGGKLASDLTLPRLQRRWQPTATSGAAPTDPRRSSAAPSGGASSRGADADHRQAGDGRKDRFGLTSAERLRVWEQANRAATAATEQIAASAGSHPAAAADAAWAASEFLAAAGRVVEGRRGGPLTEAAEQYDQAARELFGGVPQPTAAGHGLRTAGRLLLAARVAKPSENAQLLRLLAQLAALADTVTRLRETQQRAAQAAAARAAAQQLHAVVRRHQDGGVLGGAQPLATAERISAHREFTASPATPTTGRRR